MFLCTCGINADHYKAQEVINEVEGISARKPHTCPVCNGKGEVHNPSSQFSGFDMQPCPACKGACVLWG